MPAIFAIEHSSCNEVMSNVVAFKQEFLIGQRTEVQSHNVTDTFCWYP